MFLNPLSKACLRSVAAAAGGGCAINAGAKAMPVFLQQQRFIKDRASKIVKPGEAIVVDSAPHKVQKITQGKRGKGGGFVRASLKNLITGDIYEKTFTSDETVEGADLEKETYQYSWNDGDNYSFINSNTFEELMVSKEDLEYADFLLDGQEVKLVKFKGAVIGADIGRTGEYEVVAIDDAKANNTGQRYATINSGANIWVPGFINVGTKIRVNIIEREYIEKA